MCGLLHGNAEVKTVDPFSLRNMRSDEHSSLTRVVVCINHISRSTSFKFITRARVCFLRQFLSLSPPSATLPIYELFSARHDLSLLPPSLTLSRSLLTSCAIFAPSFPAFEYILPGILGRLCKLPPQLTYVSLEAASLSLHHGEFFICRKQGSPGLLESVFFIIIFFMMGLVFLLTCFLAVSQGPCRVYFITPSTLP